MFDLKKETISMGILLGATFLALKIAFYKEPSFPLLRVAVVILYLFFLPGWFLLLRWREEHSFLQRVFLGAAVSAAFVGIGSYYASLLFWPVNVYHAVLFPAALILVGYIFRNRKQVIQPHEQDPPHSE